MFARKVAARLKPNSLTEFTRLIEREILPWLRRQEGFLDLITLSAPDGTEVATISFWDHQQNAQAYSASGYPDALEILEALLDAPPYVKTFDVVHSTFRNSACAPPEKSGNPAQKSDRRDFAPSPIKPVPDRTRRASRTASSPRLVPQPNQLKKEGKLGDGKRSRNWTQPDQIPDATA
jgi:heme-degrading monooxygenase HmoA